MDAEIDLILTGSDMEAEAAGAELAALLQASVTPTAHKGGLLQQAMAFAVEWGPSALEWAGHVLAAAELTTKLIDWVGKRPGRTLAIPRPGAEPLRIDEATRAEVQKLIADELRRAGRGQSA